MGREEGLLQESTNENIFVQPNSRNSGSGGCGKEDSIMRQ